MAGLFRVTLDTRTVKRLMRGEPQAQEAAFKALSGPVFTMAKRILNDQQAAEEVTQDTFVDVITRASTVREPKAFVGWVRTVAVNHCFMRLRSPWHQRRDDIESVAESRTPHVEGQATEKALDIDQALDRLSSQERMIVWMHCIEGYTHEEIGGVFGKTASFSKAQIARAYDKLAQNRDATIPESARGALPSPLCVPT